MAPLVFCCGSATGVGCRWATLQGGMVPRIIFKKQKTNCHAFPHTDKAYRFGCRRRELLCKSSMDRRELRRRSPLTQKQPPIRECFKEFSLSNRSLRPAADQFLTRAIASLLTLNLIANDCRLRLLHFHVNLIKKKEVTDCKWNIMEAQKLIEHITTDCVKGSYCGECRTNVGDSGRVMLKLFTAATLLRRDLFFQPACW